MSGKERISRVTAVFGGQTALGRALGVRQSVVWGWVKKGFVPSERIPEIIKAAGRLDPPKTLTPNDFFEPVPSPQEVVTHDRRAA